MLEYLGQEILISKLEFFFYIYSNDQNFPPISNIGSSDFKNHATVIFYGDPQDVPANNPSKLL